MRARKVYLSHVPDDQATADDFAVRDAEVPEPEVGQELAGLHRLGLAGLGSRRTVALRRPLRPRLPGGGKGQVVVRVKQ